MQGTNMPVEHVEARLQADVEKGNLHAIEGTVQRVNYQKREVAVVAQCQVWHFTVAEDCQFWFDDKQTILRCFHPLDPVKIIFDDQASDHQAHAIYGWERC